jgi:8-oxo-dGTP pyrophosphatase MutT (NUDIX family)
MKTFYVGIKGVIVNDDKVLIVKGTAERDFWEVPGGRIDGDETIEQALHRELREELPNIKSIVLHKILDAYRVPKDIDGDTSLVLVFYKVSADFDGEPQVSEEHSESKWASKSEALDLVHESCKTAIRMAFGDENL